MAVSRPQASIRPQARCVASRWGRSTGAIEILFLYGVWLAGCRKQKGIAIYVRTSSATHVAGSRVALFVLGRYSVVSAGQHSAAGCANFKAQLP